jgi:potassium-transporting ATPase potassium-binding subunit
VAFNTAVSFVSNTSWQFYAGETSLTTFSQMTAIALQSWLSAAVGLAVGIAVIRGFSRRQTGLGNFWTDLVRGLLYVLLPLATIGALLMIADGVVQSLGGPFTWTTLAGGEQRIGVGPVAGQAAIKTLGSAPKRCSLPSRLAPLTGQRRRDHDDQQHLHEVREPARVLSGIAEFTLW